MNELSCFKAYDIRGKVPSQINENLAYKIGVALHTMLAPKTVIVGYDIRLESPKLAESLIQGLTDSGVGVINIGLCGTEEVYFHTFHKEQDGVCAGVMITASHNPKGHNGMKIVGKGSRPLSTEDLKKLQEHVRALGPDALPYSEKGLKGTETIDEDKSSYITHLLEYVDISKLKPLKIVVNAGNSAAGVVIRLLEKHLPFEFIYMNDTPDGNFPNGVPNPMIVENRTATSEAVIAHKADFGVAWDGDFDRCFLFDEQGKFIEGYYIVGLLAEIFLQKSSPEKIVHDPRLVWNSIDIVQAAGGVPVMSKSGHSFIKEKMRQENAIYGGEMSAHHYFRDFAYCDSGMIPWLMVAELISSARENLSALVDERVAAYPCSGEINYRLDDIQAVIGKIEQYFLPKCKFVDYTDGLTIEFDDWRFNIRSSNTEPLMRLNLESRGDVDIIKKRVEEIESLFQGEEK
ncbi:MAG: phosphomannomutase [Rickettsiales bacterium]|nr:MAG: phosphomannomutase [Rickettsiales bacterium]